MSKELDYITELERKNRLLGERCNQLLKDKGDLTDQIADIKANCDLAIEGRDIKIKELELELTVEKDQHQEEINLHLHAEEYIKSLEKENADLQKKLDFFMTETVEGKEYRPKSEVDELKAQVEIMKVCSNCKHFNNLDDLEYCQNCERQLVNSLDKLPREEIIKDEWELKE